MKKFKFRFEMLLKIYRLQEQFSQKIHYQTLRDLEEAKLQQKKILLEKEKSALRLGDSRDRNLMLKYLEALEQQLQNINFEIPKLLKIEIQAQDCLVEKTKKRKMIEKIRERDYDGYLTLAKKFDVCQNRLP